VTPLAGLRVVEISSFVAAPTAGLTLAQLGADVIRIDPPGGAADRHRWPVTPTGRSLYWAGLNRGKRSAELDLTGAEGRAVLHGLLGEPGDDAGIVISNVAARRDLSDDALRMLRPDLIHVQVLGRSDGGPAVDYVVNAASGLAWATGPEGGGTPVNHALPAWDLLCGMHAAVAVLAGVTRRRAGGGGSYVTVSLEDVADATLTTLGMLPEALQTQASRPALGNAVYGTFVADFTVSDGNRVLVVAVTRRQWRELLEVTGQASVVAAVEAAAGWDFADEGDRWRGRELLAGLFRPWFADRSSAEVAAAFEGRAVLWTPFRRLAERAADLRAGASPVVVARDEPGLGEMLATGGPLVMRDAGAASVPPPPAPVPGAGTDAVIDLSRQR
jgi:2-methylfumaryl-CoA isomerase